MASLSLTIKEVKDRDKKILVEMDAEKFERLAATLGFFSSDFLESLDRAERDYRAGKFRKIKSLKQLKK